MAPRSTPKRRAPAVVLDGESLTLEQLESIADGARCKLAPEARRRIRASRAVVDRATRGGAQVYGVNTGFGQLATVRIPDGKLAELQLNLVRSHAAGVGEPLTDRQVRALMALRVNCLARGHSGIRLETVQRVLAFLEHGIHPVIPRRGSVGASGDLAPLAHLALAVAGEGHVVREGRRMRTARAMKALDLPAIELEAKEGLALINGTQFMTAVGSLALAEAKRLAAIADVSGAMSIEATLGSHRAFDARIQAARPHPGQAESAENLRRLLADSEIERSHADCGRVQDAYSLRCMPQVHGAARDALRYVEGILAVEANASTDNPMVFARDEELVSGGNFHGHPVAVALDQLAVGVAALGSIAERRIERLVNPDLSGLPAFLAHDPGLHSGFMIAHVTAAAAVSENKVLAHPASVDTIPTSAGKEDHVSMGAHAGLKASDVVDNVRTVLAIELMCAAQAIDMRRPLAPSTGVQAAHRAVRSVVRHLDRDRFLSEDIERLRTAIADGTILTAVERRIDARLR